MPSLSEIAHLLLNPVELRAVIQWKVWHQPVHERDESKESATLKQCFYYLDMTSRSFAAVIKELHPELLVPICVFYLILRGLDTVEDDMTIPLDTKEPILRDFHNILSKPGWNFSGNHAKEKDRELLVHFDVVIEEFSKLKPPYQDILRDITKRMGNGMADYANNAEHNINGVDSIKDYELYCHHVAGLVGEGLTRLFVEADLANPKLLERPDLHESMGQMLQQVNIIRDIREDRDDKRRFWPKEVWSKYVPEFEDLFKPENKTKALSCLSEMVLMAIQRADDCLYYLAGIRDQSVFNFCAIPQSMAMSTLALCFNNYAVFERNVKITKGEACRNMVDSTQNLQILCEVFRSYARKIHRKNDPRDPNFLNISIACGKIEQFIESIFPSQAPNLTATGDPETASLTTAEREKIKAAIEAAKEERRDTNLVIASIAGIMFFLFAVMFGLAWLAGARFDYAFAPLLEWLGIGVTSVPRTVPAIPARGEL